MTTPPPGPWPPPPPGPGQQPPSWGSQPPWGPPPQRGGNRVKWILGGVALVVVIGLTVVATLLVTRDGSGSGEPTASAPPSTSADTSDIASADDRGPVGVILEEPTCQSWTTISASIAHSASNGWDRRDPAIPAANWTPEQRRQYGAMSAAFREASDKAAALAKETPHREVRVLYEQFIAYSREYASRIPDYAADDDQFVRASNSLSATLNAICDSITFGAAAARSPLVTDGLPPSGNIAKPQPDDPSMFLASPNPQCAEWLNATKEFTDSTAAWRTVDPNIPAPELSPEQRAINDAAISVMDDFARYSILLGRASDNPVWADISALSAQYRLAYASALPSYSPADNDLQIVAASAAGAISAACRAAGV